jgi:hypothetical protein
MFSIKLLLPVILGVIVSISGATFYNQIQTPQALLGGGAGTINQLQQWVVSLGGVVKLASTTADIRVPSLINCNTIDTDGDGIFTCGTDASGGGGGAGSISTSSVPVAGRLAFWTSPSALSSVATGTLTETITGAALSATRGLVGGAAVLSLDSGYSLPTTTLLSNLGTFYNTPSNRITAGTGIDWTSNTLNGVYTAGDAITLTGEDFDFDGGASPAGELGGTWASPTIDDTLAVTSWNLTTPTLTSFFGTPCTGNQFLQDIGDTGTFSCVTAAGGGGGLATSTAIADTYVIYGTGVGTVGAEAAFAYDDLTNTLTVGAGGAGDSTAQFGPTNGEWTLGFDDTDNSFTIASSTTLGTNNALTIAKGTLLTTLTGGLTVSTGKNITLGSTQWNVADAIDGEVIGTDTIDDDSIDFVDVTLADITFDVGSVDTTEFGYLNGVTSAIQTQFTGKQSTLTNSAGLIAALSDETGTAFSVFSDTPTFTGAVQFANATGTRMRLTGKFYDQGNLAGTNRQVLISTGTSTRWVATSTLGFGAGGGHDAVTLAGEDYLSLATQQITANAIDPDNLSASDFGNFTCNGTTCSQDDSTITEPKLDADNAPGDTDFLQYDSTGTNFIWRTLAETASDLEAAIEAGLDTLTSLVSVAISTTLAIPFGTTCDSNADGEICQDTTDNQLVVDGAVIPTTNVKLWSVTVGSTSPAFIQAGLLPVPTVLDGYTVTRYQCHVTGGTNKVIAVEDASANSSEDITCTSSNTTDDGSITNASFTASELAYIDFGATSGAVNYVTISAFGNWTGE